MCKMLELYIGNVWDTCDSACKRANSLLLSFICISHQNTFCVVVSLSVVTLSLYSCSFGHSVRIRYVCNRLSFSSHSLTTLLFFPAFHLRILRLFFFFRCDYILFAFLNKNSRQKTLLSVFISSDTILLLFGHPTSSRFYFSCHYTLVHYVFKSDYVVWSRHLSFVYH